MFRPRIYAVTISCALLVGGCQADGRNAFINEGIGTNLHTSDVADQSVLLERYLGSICRQAGLEIVLDGDDGSVRCRNDGVFGRHWSVVAFQGMNDIDRRCDAYLAWLDNKRRSRGPKLAQVAAVRTATEAVMGSTNASTRAIAVVGSAFGLISSAIDNRNARLIFAIDSASVQNIVLRSRTRYRNEVPITRIGTRPEAIHVIREYLNICLPHNIETEINASVTERERSKETLEPLIGASVRQAFAFPKTTKDPVSPSGDASKKIVNHKTAIERNIAESDGIRIQENLCLDKPDGNFGDRTRAAIILYRKAKNFMLVIEKGQKANPVNDTIDNDTELKDLRFTTICNRSEYRNAFEKFLLPNGTRILQLQQRLPDILKKAGVSPVPKIKQTGTLDSDTRKAFKTLGEKTGAQDATDPEALTPKLYQKIVDRL